MKNLNLLAGACAAMLMAFAPIANAAPKMSGGGGGMGGMRMHSPGGGGGMGGLRMRSPGGGMSGMRMRSPGNFNAGIVRNNPGNFVNRPGRNVRLGQNWAGKGDHHGRHHRRGYWRGGTFIALGALGYPYYDNYYSSYGCDYYYDRWQETGSRYWRNRYYECID